MLFRRLDLELVEGHDVVMTSGATIHTRDGMLVNARRRDGDGGGGGGEGGLGRPATAKDIGEGWFERGIEGKASGGAGKCPMPFVK